MVTHSFHPGTWEAKAGYALDFKASLAHIVNSRPARIVQQDPAPTHFPTHPQKERGGRERLRKETKESVGGGNKSFELKY